jgi:modulator of FtsH protease HflK
VADRENVSADEKVRRSVARTLGNGAFLLLVLAILGAWAWLGVFTLQPGQAAVLLGLGAHWGTIVEPGFHLAPPPPLVTREVVNVAEVRSEDFGIVGDVDEASQPAKLHEATMQTSDNNIVLVSFAVQYRIKDAFAYRFRLADPVMVVRDAAQAAMREVVGRMTVDAVLRERRAALTAEAGTLLQDVLDTYDSGIDIQDVQLQDVQPPDAVRAAFDDVNEATQDAIRVVNEADGFRNQTIPSARAEAAELLEQAEADKSEKIAAATGAASRFSALRGEYEKAPEVTRERLYLETMEAVLPDVEKVIVDPEVTQLMPYLPIGRERGLPAQPGAQP